MSSGGGFSLRRFRAIVVKEFIQMRRDRMTVGMMIGIPAIQLLLFGYAINLTVENVPIAVVDRSLSAESRRLISSFENSRTFVIAEAAASEREVESLINRGKVKGALVIPSDYARNLATGQSARVQMIVDAADPTVATAATSGAAQIGQVYSTQVLMLRSGPATGATAAAGLGAPDPPVDVRVRAWYNPTLETARFIVPGLIGVILSITLVLITAMAVVRERERGTLEQLIVTPIGRLELMLGKITPYVLVGYVQMTVVLLLGWLLFGVEARGSVTLLYVLTLAFIVGNLGIGLFLSTLARNQQQAMQLGYFFILPNILLSGFMFPRSAMPLPAQWLGWPLPLTFYLDILRGIVLRGVGMSYLWDQVLVLVGLSTVVVALSVARFRKRLD